MEGIKIFERQEFGQVRVVDVNGEPWFVARDVCEALGYTWSGSRISHIPEEWKGMTSVVTPGMALEMLRDAGVDEKGVTTNYTPGGMQDIPGEWKGRNWIMTPGGEQEMSMISGALK